MSTLNVGILRHTLFLRSEQFITTQAMALTTPPVLLARDQIVNPVPGLRVKSMTSGSPQSRIAYMMNPEKYIREAAQELELSILHAHFGVEGEVSVKASRDLGIAHFTTLHGYDVSRSTKSLLTSRKPAWIRYALRRRRFLSNPHTTFICVSEHVREKAIELGADDERVKVIFNGVDVGALNPSPVPEPPRIVHVARLVEKKGTQHLIKAMKQVRASVQGAVLDIIGDGPLRTDLEALVKAESLEGIVVFHGARPHAFVLQAIRESMVMCAPSIEARSGDQEGLPQVILEASALGRPVVGTRHSGIPEAVIDGVSGVLVNEGDEDALAEALVSVVGNHRFAAKLGSNAAQIASERFSVTESARSLESLYESRTADRPL